MMGLITAGSSGAAGARLRRSGTVTAMLPHGRPAGGTAGAAVGHHVLPPRPRVLRDPRDAGPGWGSLLPSKGVPFVCLFFPKCWGGVGKERMV